MILKIGDMVKLSQAGTSTTVHYSLDKDYGFIVAFEPCDGLGRVSPGCVLAR
jgi:hypothetical protein